MKTIRVAILFMMLFHFPGVTAAASTETPSAGRVIGEKTSQHPPWFKQSFLEIDEDVDEAGEAGKHVILYFEYDGCPYCYRTIEENFKADSNEAFVQRHFDVIPLNVLGDREVALNETTTATEKEIARRLNVVYYPTMIVLNERNQVVLRMAGYRNRKDFKAALDYVQQRAYETQTFTAFSNDRARNDRYRFRRHPQLRELTDLSKIVDKPLAVLFEAADCRDCDALHDGHLGDPRIRSLLDRFTLVRIDALAETSLIDVGGEKTTGRDFARKLGIDYRPSIVFFDRGREIIRIESTLYRYHFTGVLEYVAERQYERYPDLVWDYVDDKTARLIAAGEDVYLSDD